LRALTVLITIVAIAIFAKCTREVVRGDGEPSVDGGTYLAIMDRNGCTDLKVDGTDWPWEEGVAKPIAPGTHRIACAGESSRVEFTIKKGEKFNFDYWGP